MKRNIIALVIGNLLVVILASSIALTREYILASAIAMLMLLFNAAHLSLLLWLSRPTVHHRKPEKIDGGIEL